MSSRRLLVGSSVGVALGIAGLVLPRYFEGTLPGSLLTAFAFVVVGAVPLLFVRRRGTAVDRPSLPTPERPAPARVPGERFDTLLDDAHLTRRGEATHSLRRIRDRLRTVATETLVAYERLSSADAVERLEDGSWTDDGVAAAFLRTNSPEIPPSRGSLGRIRSDSDPVRDAIGRSIAALVRTAGRVSETPSRASFRDRVTERLRGARTDETESRYTVTSSEPTVRVTNRWRGIGAVALLGIGAGVGLEEPAILLVGAIGVGYAAYARTAFQPPIDVTATRTLGDASPRRGEVVPVTVTVRNDGSRPLPDIRLIDGVPEAIGVEDGSPRHGTTLPAGSETTFTYTIRARRGRHEFGPVRVLGRDLAETIEHDLTVPAATTFTCRPRSTTSIGQPLRRRLAQFVGRIPTTKGGDGIEFHSTREYRRGDPMRRVDWKRLARTGTLSTIALREERATTVILIVDGRSPAHVAPRPDALTASDRGVDAAARIAPWLRQEGHAVGVAALSPIGCWISPSSARVTESRITEALTTHPAFAQSPPADACYTADWIDEFRRRFSQPAQVVFLSPICDHGAARAARSLEEFGYPVTVVSPDPTTLDTEGNQLATLEREVRLHELRRAGVRVVDWDRDRPLEGAILRASSRWSR